MPLCHYQHPKHYYNHYYANYNRSGSDHQNPYLFLTLGISTYLNNSLLIPKDANGSVVAPFIVNGTTYLPVRAIANALNLAVDWNSSSYTITLNSSDQNEELAFFRNNAAIVIEDDDTYYHHFDCPNWQDQNISYSIPTWQMSLVISPARTAGIVV